MDVNKIKHKYVNQQHISMISTAGTDPYTLQKNVLSGEYRLNKYLELQRQDRKIDKKKFTFITPVKAEGEGEADEEEDEAETAGKAVI